MEKDDDNDSVTSEDFNDFLDKMGGKKASLLDEGDSSFHTKANFYITPFRRPPPHTPPHLTYKHTTSHGPPSHTHIHHHFTILMDSQNIIKELST